MGKIMSRLLMVKSFLLLAGIEDMHKGLDEFEFLPDLTNNYGVSCP